MVSLFKKYLYLTNVRIWNNARHINRDPGLLFAADIGRFRLSSRWKWNYAIAFVDEDPV